MLAPYLRILQLQLSCTPALGDSTPSLLSNPAYHQVSTPQNPPAGAEQGYSRRSVTPDVDDDMAGKHDSCWPLTPAAQHAAT